MAATSTVGNRMRRRTEGPAEDLIAALRQIATANIADAMNKHGAMSADIRPTWQGMPRVVGPALTVKALAGDSLVLRKAMDVAQEGDVIVFAGQGSTHAAVWGGNCSVDMVHKRVAGLIVDGAVRDNAESAILGFPIFARGLIARTGTQCASGEINYPVSCGGIVVMPGDIIVADAEGIVAIPIDDASAVIQAALEVQGTKGAPEDIKARFAATSPGTVHGLNAAENALRAMGFATPDKAGS